MCILPVALPQQQEAQYMWQNVYMNLRNYDPTLNSTLQWLHC